MEINKKVKILSKIPSVVFVALLCLGLTSCNQSSKESIQLTEKMIVMVESAKTSHLQLVDVLINQQKVKADDYLDSIADEYWDSLCKQPAIKEDLDKKYATTKERDLVVRQIYQEAARDFYGARRAKLMDSLEELRVDMKHRIGNHYDEILLSAKTVLTYLKTSSQTPLPDEIVKIAAAAASKYQEDPFSNKMISENINSLFEGASGDYSQLGTLNDKIKNIKNELSK